MKEQSRKLGESIDHIRKTVPTRIRLAVVLGSGLGGFADSLPEPKVIETRDIPHFPRAGVVGHKGRLIFSCPDGVPVLAFQGRSHIYESGDAGQAVYPIRVAHELGARIIVLTNAAGGVDRNLLPGDLMTITDQLNLTGIPSFAAGIQGARRGSLYSERLLKLADTVASSLGLRLHHGVYACVKGPSYETPSEVGMVLRLGGDAVGMSTVFESEMAASVGMEVLGISCITNMASGIRRQKLEHEEVTRVGQKVQGDFSGLLRGIIKALSIDKMP
ncbi:MAG: purine-nucleoside phosphorylase [Bacteroidota bacterium]